MASVPLRHIEQPGLEWEEDLFSCEPHWTKEPSIDIIKTLVVRHFDLDKEAPDVSFFAEGAFNKLYAVDCGRGRFIFRATLPVAPGVKTKSEVATLAFVRENTTIPVPQVFAYDADLNNALGFEWILMERIDARPLHEVWHSMSWLKKGLLVMKIADYTAQLFRLEMRTIGSLYLTHDPPGFTLGETVLPQFFKSTNIHLDIPRGPFASSRAYITARIQLTQHWARKLDLTDDDDAEHYADIQAVLSGIQTLLPRLFLAAQDQEQEQEPTTLCNRDISASNMLITPHGDLASIVDWECTAFVPHYQAVAIPAFLKGPALAAPPEPQTPSTEAHLEQLEQYEKARLREFFVQEMARVEPGWVRVYESQRVCQDVLLAMEYCENDMLVKWARGWVEKVVQGGGGSVRSLAEVGK